MQNSFYAEIAGNMSPLVISIGKYLQLLKWALLNLTAKEVLG